MVNSGSFDAAGSEGESVKAEFTQLEDDAAEANFTAVVPSAAAAAENTILDISTEKPPVTSLQCSVPLEKVKNVLEFCNNKSKLNNYLLLENFLKQKTSEISTDMSESTSEFIQKPAVKRLLCLFCDRTFTSNNLKQKHVDRCHSAGQTRRSSSRIPNQNQSTTACCFCSKLNHTDHTLKQLLEHLIQEHSNRYFACLSCQERFNSVQALRDHNRIIHGLQEPIESKTSPAAVPTESVDNATGFPTPEVSRPEFKRTCSKDSTSCNENVLPISAKENSSPSNLTTKPLKRNASLKNIPAAESSEHDKAKNTSELLTDFEDSIRANIISPEEAKKLKPPAIDVEDVVLTRRLRNDALNSKTKNANKKSQIVNKKISVKSTKNGVRNNLRTTRASVKQMSNNFSKNRKNKIIKNDGETNKEIVTKKPEPNPSSVFSLVNAYTYKYEKIYDHASDSIKDANSVQFNAVFDKEFYSRTVCNIRENLLHHLDGKLNRNIESESRISNFEHNTTSPPEIESKSSNDAVDNFGCDLSLNAVTPVATLLGSSQYGEDFDAQIEYGAKASQKKSKKITVVKYKFPNKKYNSLFYDRDSHNDLTGLDMWTQLSVKKRQHKYNDDSNFEPDLLNYEHRTSEARSRVTELNRILDTRGPFEDLRLEANAAQFLELRKKSVKDGDYISEETSKDVYFILEDLLNRVVSKCNENSTTQSEIDIEEVKDNDELEIDTKSEIQSQNLEIPSYLQLQRNSSHFNQIKIDKTDSIALICSSQDEKEMKENKRVELTGEWARPRIYICAACGLKLPNLKSLEDHKNIGHTHIWCSHYEFVGCQSHTYRHLSIPGLGKVGIVEQLPINRLWQRSDARVCSKCSKQCHNLGELHKHILECGGDWTWMLARKKCKYRPYGARTRRRRQRGYKRSCNPEVNRAREHKPKIKPIFIGPRPKPSKPSDAETIERMLANLPPKRNRKMISMRDGIQRPRKPYKQKLNQNSSNTPSNMSPKSTNKKVHFKNNSPQITKQTLRNALKRKISANNLRKLKNNDTENEKIEAPVKLRSRIKKSDATENTSSINETEITQQLIGKRTKIRNKRMISRILGSKIFDSNSALVTRRKLVKAITQNNIIRKTRLRTKINAQQLTNQNEEDSVSETEEKIPLKSKNTQENDKKTKIILKNNDENYSKSHITENMNTKSGELDSKPIKKLNSKRLFSVLTKSGKKNKISITDKNKIDTVSAVIDEVVNKASKNEFDEILNVEEKADEKIRRTRRSNTVLKAELNEIKNNKTDETVDNISDTLTETKNDILATKKSENKIIDNKKTNKLVQNVKSFRKSFRKPKTNQKKSGEKSEGIASKLIRTFSLRGSKRKKPDSQNEIKTQKVDISSSNTIDQEITLKKTTIDASNQSEDTKDENETAKGLEPVIKLCDKKDPEFKPINDTEIMPVLEKIEPLPSNISSATAVTSIPVLCPVDTNSSGENSSATKVEDKTENHLNVGNDVSDNITDLPPCDTDKLCSNNTNNTLNKFKNKLKRSGRGLNDCIAMLKCKLEQKYPNNEPHLADKSNLFILNSSEDDKHNQTVEKFENGNEISSSVESTKVNQGTITNNETTANNETKKEIIVVNNKMVKEKTMSETNTEISIENKLIQNVDSDDLNNKKKPETNNTNLLEIPSVKINSKNEVSTSETQTQTVEEDIVPNAAIDYISTNLQTNFQLSYVLNATLQNCLMECVKNKCEKFKIENQSFGLKPSQNKPIHKIGSVRKRIPRRPKTSKSCTGKEKHIPNIPMLLNTAFTEKSFPKKVNTPTSSKTASDTSDDDVPLSKFVSNSPSCTKLKIKLPVAKKKRRSKNQIAFTPLILNSQDNCAPQHNLQDRIEQRISLDDSINNKVQEFQNEVAAVKEQMNNVVVDKEVDPISLAKNIDNTKLAETGNSFVTSNVEELPCNNDEPILDKIKESEDLTNKNESVVEESTELKEPEDLTIKNKPLFEESQEPEDLTTKNESVDKESIEPKNFTFKNKSHYEECKEPENLPNQSVLRENNPENLITTNESVDNLNKEYEHLIIKNKSDFEESIELKNVTNRSLRKQSKKAENFRIKNKSVGKKHKELENKNKPPAKRGRKPKYLKNKDNPASEEIGKSSDLINKNVSEKDDSTEEVINDELFINLNTEEHIKEKSAFLNTEEQPLTSYIEPETATLLTEELHKPNDLNQEALQENTTVLAEEHSKLDDLNKEVLQENSLNINESNNDLINVKELEVNKEIIESQHPLSQQIMAVEDEPYDSFLINKTLTEANIKPPTPIKNLIPSHSDSENIEFINKINNFDSGKENTDCPEIKKKKVGRKPKKKRRGRSKIIQQQTEIVNQYVQFSTTSELDQTLSISKLDQTEYNNEELCNIFVEDTSLVTCNETLANNFKTQLQTCVENEPETLVMENKNIQETIPTQINIYSPINVTPEEQNVVTSDSEDELPLALLIKSQKPKNTELSLTKIIIKLCENASENTCETKISDPELCKTSSIIEDVPIITSFDLEVNLENTQIITENNYSNKDSYKSIEEENNIEEMSDREKETELALHSIENCNEEINITNKDIQTEIINTFDENGSENKIEDKCEENESNILDEMFNESQNDDENNSELQNLDESIKRYENIKIASENNDNIQNEMTTPDPTEKSVEEIFDFLKTPTNTQNSDQESSFITTPDLTDKSLVIKIKTNLKIKIRKPKKTRRRVIPKELSKYNLKKKEKEEEELNVSVVCEICNKTFKRKENLTSHKRTLTHISKLSEIEARESMSKIRKNNDESNENTSNVHEDDVPIVEHTEAPLQANEHNEKDNTDYDKEQFEISQIEAIDPEPISLENVTTEIITTNAEIENEDFSIEEENCIQPDIIDLDDVEIDSNEITNDLIESEKELPGNKIIVEDKEIIEIDDESSIDSQPEIVKNSENFINKEPVVEILDLEPKQQNTNLLPNLMVNSTNSNLKLVDIISQVLDKPVNDLNIGETDYLPQNITRAANNCDADDKYSEPKRYKSLGERKSFDSDNFNLSTKCNDERISKESYSPPLGSVNNGLLSKQLSLLENIIEETNPDLNYIDDSMSLSSNQFEPVEQNISEKYLFKPEYTKLNNPQIKFSHNADILSNFIKPANHFNNFENISESFAKPTKQKHHKNTGSILEDEEQKNSTNENTKRKILNRDEELFLECCSLLKSGSEVSGVSRKATKNIPLNNFSRSNDASWIIQKQQYSDKFIQRDSYSWLAQSSRVDTPIGEPLVSNDWSNSNSAVSSEWLAQKAPSPDRPTESNTLMKKSNNNSGETKYSDNQFEDISLDTSLETSKTLMAVDNTSNENMPLDFHHVDFSNKNFIENPEQEDIQKEISEETNKLMTNTIIELDGDSENTYSNNKEQEIDLVQEKQDSYKDEKELKIDEVPFKQDFDTDLKKKVVSAFGGLMAKALTNRLHAVVRKSKKSKGKREFVNAIQASITDYAVPVKKNKLNHADSDSNDCPKKLMTKGAMKVFEGIKVSIPTQDLNLQEVLNCNNKPKNGETKEFEPESVKNGEIKENEILEENNKNGKLKNLFNRFGNKLGLKETKRKSEKHRNLKSKNHINIKKTHDIYEFEESVDSTYMFKAGKFSLFRNNSEKLENTADPNKKAEEEKIDDTKLNHESGISSLKWNENESDSDTDRYYDSMSFEEMSLSSESTHESNLNLNKIKTGQKKNLEKSKENQKKCMIMGRIFKNASKPKLEDKIPEIRDISSEENSKLVENYLDSCSSVDNGENLNNHTEISTVPNNVTVLNSSVNKMSKIEMDLLFDKLLEEEKKNNEKNHVLRVENEQHNKEVHEFSLPAPVEKNGADKKKIKEGKLKLPGKAKKRQRHNSGDSTSSDEFTLSNRNSKSTKKNHKTPRKSTKIKKDTGINLEQEFKECIGVAGRKSQRKCTSGKQNVLIEFWSSDESSFEETIKKFGKENKPIPLVEDNKIEEIPSPEPEESLENNNSFSTSNHDIPNLEKVENTLQNNVDIYEFDSDVEIKQDNIKIKIKINEPIHKLETEFIPTTKIRIPKKTKKVGKTRKHSKSHGEESDDTEYEAEKKRRRSEHKRKKSIENGNTLELETNPDCLAVTRKKRNAGDQLYYWSSSSDDEFQDLIEVKPIREDTDDDRPMQHGWIVGDSPKKLVTMLAQAKGKKVEGESVKEQGKKNRITL